MPYASKEKQAEYWRQYAKKNNARIKVRKRRWYAENKEQLRDAQRARYKADPEKYREYFRRYHVKSAYGISGVEYAKMVLEQDGKCAICGREPSRRSKKEMNLDVDHDHSTGAVRGLLCSPCNRALGLFTDSKEKLEAALVYLDGAQKEGSHAG